MPTKPSAPRALDTLSFKIGRWAEANATGWGLAVLVVLAILLTVVVLNLRPSLRVH